MLSEPRLPSLGKIIRSNSSGERETAPPSCLPRMLGTPEYYGGAVSRSPDQCCATAKQQVKGRCSFLYGNSAPNAPLSARLPFSPNPVLKPYRPITARGPSAL